MMKRCFKCGRELPESEFHKSRRSKDGLMQLQGWVGSMGCQTDLSFALGLGIPRGGAVKISGGQSSKTTPPVGNTQNQKISGL